MILEVNQLSVWLNSLCFSSCLQIPTLAFLDGWSMGYHLQIVTIFSFPHAFFSWVYYYSKR